MALYDLDKLHDAVDAIAVAEYFGIPMEKHGRRISILCPNSEHNDEHFGNCFLYEHGYHCFACGAYGDAVNLLMEAENMSRREAFDFLAEFSGGKDLFQLDQNAEKKYCRVLPNDKLELIGLAPASKRPIIYTAMYDYEPEELPKGEKLHWFPRKDDDEGYYLSAKKLPSPLRQLAANDYKEYVKLICDKANERIEMWQDVIDHVASHDYEKGSLIDKIIKPPCTPADLIEACNQNIAEIEDIILQFGGEIKRRHIFRLPDLKKQEAVL